MPIIQINTHPIYYTQHTNGTPLARLFLIHGAGGTHTDWPRELLRLPNTHAITLDLPGHGRSKGNGYTNIDGYVAVVEAFLRGQGLETGGWGKNTTPIPNPQPPIPTILIGHSMGGAISQTIAARHPELVDGLVLVATGAKLGVNKEFMDGMKADWKSAVSSLSQKLWRKDTHFSNIDSTKRKLQMASQTVTYGDFYACNKFDIREELSNIDVPTLVISGTADMLTPAKFGRYLAEHIPQTEYEEYQHAGHMLMLEEPERTATLVQAYLKNHFPIKAD